MGLFYLPTICCKSSSLSNGGEGRRGVNCGTSGDVKGGREGGCKSVRVRGEWAVAMRGGRGEAPTSQRSSIPNPHLFQRRLRLHRWELLQAANWELIEAEIVALQQLHHKIEFVFAI